MRFFYVIFLLAIFLQLPLAYSVDSNNSKISSKDLLNMPLRNIIRQTLPPHNVNKVLERTKLYKSSWYKWELLDAIHEILGEEGLIFASRHGGKIYYERGSRYFVIIDDPIGHYFRIQNLKYKGKNPDFSYVDKYYKGFQFLEEAGIYVSRDEVLKFQEQTHFSYTAPAGEVALLQRSQKGTDQKDKESRLKNSSKTLVKQKHDDVFPKNPRESWTDQDDFINELDPNLRAKKLENLFSSDLMNSNNLVFLYNYAQENISPAEIEVLIAQIILEDPIWLPIFIRWESEMNLSGPVHNSLIYKMRILLHSIDSFKEKQYFYANLVNNYQLRSGDPLPNEIKNITRSTPLDSNLLFEVNHLRANELLYEFKNIFQLSFTPNLVDLWKTLAQIDVSQLPDKIIYKLTELISLIPDKKVITAIDLFTDELIKNERLNSYWDDSLKSLRGNMFLFLDLKNPENIELYFKILQRTPEYTSKSFKFKFYSFETKLDYWNREALPFLKKRLQNIPNNFEHYLDSSEASSEVILCREAI